MTTSADNSQPVTRQREPIFAIVAALLLVVCFITPLILLTMPVLLTIGSGAVAIARKEKLRWLAIVSMLGALFIMFAGSSQLSNIGGKSAANIDAVKIVQWNWNVDPDFGSNGTVKWNAEVKNVSDRPISSVELKLTTYDKAGKLLGARSGYINAIPPGGTKADEHFADYFGTEDSAKINIESVRFSDN